MADPLPFVPEEEATGELKNIYTNAFITLQNDKFSPNSDGLFDSLTLNPVVNVKDDIAVYKLEILNKANNIIKVYQGLKSVPDEIVWDGKTLNDDIAPDSIYYAKLSVIYEFGNPI